MITDINQLEISWLHDFSHRSFCQKILGEIDKIVGTTYLPMYGLHRAALDTIISDIARVAKLHDLVVIVVTDGAPSELPLSVFEQRRLDEFLSTFRHVTGISIVYEHNGMECDN